MGLATNAVQVDLSEIDKTEIERLRLTHELWNLYSADWDLNLSSYEGGSDMVTERNLFKHSRENTEDFQDRVKRCHYMNYCAPIVDFFTNFIYAETINRDGGTNAPYYQDFIQNVDRRGNSIDDYMRAVSDDMQIFGMSYIMVDTPKLPDDVDPALVTKQYEQDNNIRPYWVTMRPNEVVDWVTDDFDTFKYLKRRQIVNDIDVAGQITTIEKYTEWTVQEVRISRIDVTDPSKIKLLPAETLPNRLNTIPISVARYKRSKRHPHMGNSFLRDFSVNNREIMNLTSLLQDFLYRQAFNILAVQTESSIPLAEQQDGEFGTSNRMEVPKGVLMPEYITPPSDPAQFIRSEIATIKNEMFLMAAQDTLTELFNGEKASGFSQAQSFSKTVPFISSRADTLEKVEKQLMQLTYKLIGKTWDGKIKYKDRYELTNLNDALTQLMILARDLQLPSEDFVKAELIRFTQEFDGKLNDDIRAKVISQINAMDFDKWQETQKEVLIGAGGNSPAAQQKPKNTGTMAEASKEAKVKTGATKKVKS
jgi:hypothetical protein